MRRLVTILVLGTVWGCAGRPTPAKAQAPESTATVARTKTLTAEDIVRLHSVSSVAVSPDRRRVAYVLRTPRDPTEKPGGSRNVIWVVSSKGGDAKRFTAPNRSSHSPQWAPNGKSLAFVSGRPEDDGSQIYLIPLAGGEPERITQVDGGVSSFAWSPDGKSIAYLAKRKDTDAEKLAKTEGRDWQTTDVVGTARRLWVLDLSTQKAKAVGEPSFHVSRFAWAPDNKRFVVQANKRADIDGVMMYSSLFITSTEGAWGKLTDTAGKLGGFAWSPRGNEVAFLGAADLNDPTAGVLYVVAAKGGPARALTASYKGTGQWVRWTEPGGLLMAANEGTKTIVQRVSPSSGVMRRLLVRGPVCSRVNVDPTGRTLVCAGSTPTHPREVFYGAIGSGNLKRLTHSNPQLRDKTLGHQSTIRWKAKDGLEIEGVLIKPVGYAKGTRYPLAVLPHGGPEGVTHHGWTTGTGYPAQLFANRGFVVLMPNYRGSQGRGVAFGKADQQDLGGKEFQDVLDGIDWLQAEGIVDADRVGMGGWSYGGYFSGLAATLHSDRFKAAMVGAAITNWVSFTGTSEIEHENSLVHWKMWPYDDYAKVWQRSPMAHAASSKTATLIVHGKSDTRVPPEQATELYRALRHFKVNSEIVLYPREGHGLHERAHQLDFAERFVRWFEANVKG